MIAFHYHDGGRAAAGYKGKVGDCATRAIAIATGKPYREVYNALNDLAWLELKHPSKRRRGVSNSRTGVHKITVGRYMESIGWQFFPTMGIGTGCKVHLRADELPPGRLVVNLSRHFAAVIDRELYDNHDSSRDGSRCVYGYWREAK